MVVFSTIISKKPSLKLWCNTHKDDRGLMARRVMLCLSACSRNLYEFCGKHQLVCPGVGNSASGMTFSLMSLTVLLFGTKLAFTCIVNGSFGQRSGHLWCGPSWR